MARKELYSVRDLGGSKGYEVLKMDRDWNPSGRYLVSVTGRDCECFAGNKSTCRHRQMVGDYMNQKTITIRQEDQSLTYHTPRELYAEGWWYEFDRELWVKGPSQDVFSD